MSDVDGFLEGVSALGQDEPVVAAVVQPEAAPAPEPPAPEPPVASPPAQPEPPAPVVEEPKQVPLATFLDVLGQKKDLERRNAEFEARARAPAQPQEIPDPVDDPNGFVAYQTAQVQDLLTRERFTMSANMAKATYGDETVETARQWALQRAAFDPSFDLAMGQQAHPIDWIVRQHKRDGLVSQIGDKDLDTFVKDYVTANPEKFGLSAPAAVAAPVAAMGSPAPVAEAPPRSLAAAPSSGGAVKDIPMGPMAALESVFK
jgi:hypothetical protein